MVDDLSMCHFGVQEERFSTSEDHSWDDTVRGAGAA